MMPVHLHVEALLRSETLLKGHKPGDKLFKPAADLIMAHYRSEHFYRGYRFPSTLHTATVLAADGTEVRLASHG